MKRIISAFLIAVGVVAFSAPASSQVLSDYSSVPPFVSASVPPSVMFVMAKDHKLFYKAYNDLLDLDEDGTIDTTYKDTIDYYGYFDSNKCYSYSSSRFTPAALATGANLHYCSGNWSGNFLNWATMSRMDIIRKVLYGGYRTVDTSTTTVLSRATLPRDAHSWVKVYTGSDIDDLTPTAWTAITLCNLNTAKTGAEATSSLVWILEGAFPYAASTEVAQCRIQEQVSSPTKLTPTYAYYVDIVVCVSSPLTMLDPNCQEYKQGSSASGYKPVGVLQKLGVDRKGTVDTSDDVSQMKFGMLSGSYGASKAGGVLRSNMSDMLAEIDNANGMVKSSSEIIKTINGFKATTNYTYPSIGSSSPYSASGSGYSNTNIWGNPIGEMLYETIRYYQGRSSYTSQFYVNDPNFSEETQWYDPYGTCANCAKCPYCTKPFTLILSDLTPSYDSDHLPGSYWPTTISTSDTPSVQTLIANSGINTLDGVNKAFVGQYQGTIDNKCTPKGPASGVADFGQIRGVCVEEPTRQGSYYIAGLAHYAHTTDLNAIQGDQKMTTYVVAAGSSVPTLEFEVGPDPATALPVQILPIFHDGCPDTTLAGCTSLGQYGDNSKGQIADFQYCRNDADWTTEQGNAYTDCFDILWDDSEEGGDYDLDTRYRIYVKKTNTTITVKTKGLYANAGHTGFMGYIISGVSISASVTADDIYDLRCGGSLAGSTDCDRASDGNETAAVERTFTAVSSSSGFLKDPLWYAAKYGGFEDSNASGTPDLQKEWDEDNDGVPDTFYRADNPLQLEAKLTEALADILSKSSSGTSVSVLATSSGGEGAIYQAYFYPSIFEGTEEIAWLGYLQGLFFDADGQLREDSNQDGALVLKGTNADKVVQTFFDTSNQETRVRRYNVDANGDPTGTPEVITLSEMNPIWEAGKKLAARDTSTNPRKIYTWIDDTPYNNSVEAADEFIPFTTANESRLRSYLRAANATEGTNIINFIRGEAVTGYRAREVTVSGVSGTPTWRLGDIVYSSPVSVGGPSERFDLRYQDTTYNRFYQKYKDRRHVVYVGANDGMLHAFNAGFFHRGDDPDTPDDVEHSWFTLTDEDGNGGELLGEELWAFIPQELLPHLKWLTGTDYDRNRHVYFVDGSPRIADVQIFDEGTCSVSLSDPACKYPGGWGTILIGSMRLGGGVLKVDLNGDGDTTDAGEDRFRSAYFALDITDPEATPTLLWVYKEGDMGFTGSWPAVIRMDNSGTPVWYAAFGSGPTTYRGERATSGSTNKFETTISDKGWIYIVNLKTGALVKKIQADGATADANAFMGDPSSFDLPRDYDTDVLYIGKTYYSSGWKGKVYRLVMKSVDFSSYDLNVLYNPGQPVLSKPTATMDNNNRLWIFFGTGRYFSTGTSSDQTDTSNHGLYGIKESGTNGCWDGSDWKTSCPTTAVPSTDLFDATSASISVGGACASCGSATTLTSLVTAMASKQGWYITLTGGERVLHEATILGGIVAATTFKPNATDVCSVQGTNALYAMYFQTGTAFTGSTATSIIGLESDGTTVKRKLDLGTGVASKVNVVVSDNTITGFVQSSTGEILQISDIKTSSSVRQGTKVFKEISAE